MRVVPEAEGAVVVVDADDVTLPEVWRAVLRIERKVDNLDVVHASVFAASQAEQDRRLAALESARDWAVRAVVGAIIVGAIGLLFTLASVSP